MGVRNRNILRNIQTLHQIFSFRNLTFYFLVGDFSWEVNERLESDLKNSLCFVIYLFQKISHCFFVRDLVT